MRTGFEERLRLLSHRSGATHVYSGDDVRPALHALAHRFFSSWLAGGVDS